MVSGDGDRALVRARTSEDDDEAWREPLDRDCDIVLYSSAWRRLRGVTQVSPVTTGLSRTHDRMIHSLKVAQVGLRIAERLVQQPNQGAPTIWPKAVYAAGLAHDLGHPPFGHIAEKELQSILTTESRWRLTDSFEGNAQTFRILTRLSLKATDDSAKPVGMNLTPITLAACTKYPWAKGEAQQELGDQYNASLSDYYEKKWGFYDSDARAWADVRDKVEPGVGPYSINALIMDLADDVTYAIHDVHDYFRAGLIPLDRIGAGFEAEGSSPSTHYYRSDEYEEFTEYARTALSIKRETQYSVALMKAAMKWLANLSYPVGPYRDTATDRRLLHQFESRTVGAVQSAVTVEDGRLVIPPEIQLALETLKELTWFYVINHPHLSASQEGQRRIIRDLHEWLCVWAAECQSKGDFARQKIERNVRRLPARFRELMSDPTNERASDSRISRAAVDYIVGLTDMEAINLHHHLGGTTENLGPVTWLGG